MRGARASTSGIGRRGVDAVIVAGVFAYNLPIQGLGTSRDSWLALAFPIGLCFPYLWHRRRPLVVCVVIAATAFVQLGFGVGLLVADVMLLPALYSVARSRDWTWSIPAAQVVVLWALAAALPRRDVYGFSFGDIGLLVLAVITTWLLGVLARTRREYIDSLHQRAQQMELQHQAHASIAAAAERTRVAREIHDIVSHSLSAIVLLSEGAASTVRHDPDRAADTMVTVRDTGRKAMTEMRSMLSVLREEDSPDRGPAPGVGDLDDLIAQSTAVGVPASLTVSGAPQQLSEGAALVLYRVVQEALTNVRKHAGPQVTSVRVGLTYRDEEVEVAVSDDGRGGGVDSGGLGLLGMRERVAAQGGSLVTRGHDAGFDVVAVLPVGAA